LNARLCLPEDVAVDAAGNPYILDNGNHTIRKRTPDGKVSTLAGLAGKYGVIDGSGAAARFGNASGLAVDAVGNIYVAERSANVIRKVSPSGVVTTLAGTAGSSGSADGIGAAARFTSPTDVAVDASGNVYVADRDNNTIRKITPAGVVTTLAGSAGQWGDTEGAGSAARFQALTAVAVDAVGNVYVSETFGARIRKISPAGETSTLAGAPNTSGHIDGTGSAARLEYPSGLAVDAAGNVYVSSRNGTVRKITPGGVVTTMAGTRNERDSTDGMGSVARFGIPEGVAADAAGNVYVADTTNNTIRKITPDGTVSTVAGLSTKGSQGHVDGSGTSARFSTLGDLVVDASGNLYVADPGNHCIRKVTPAGLVTTFAGSPASVGSVDGTGTAASFGRPMGVALDASGNLYVSDAEFHVIRKITAGGVVTTLAGSPGQPGLVNGIGAAARFRGPTGIDVDGDGNVWVMDRDNSAARRITPAGEVSTIYTRPGFDYLSSMPGIGSLTYFLNPNSLAIGRGRIAGTPVFVNTNYHTIELFNSGTSFIVAGRLDGFPGFADGISVAAAFYLPTDVAVDGTGDMYVAANGNGLIRRIAGPEYVVSTLAGSLFIDGRFDGIGDHAGFEAPYGITADAAGNLWVSDGASIRKGRLPAAPSITTQPQSQSVATGGSVTFSVVANGAPDPTYQWHFNGNAFAGATNSSLSFSNARSSDAGEYTVVVANSLGSVTSTKATLTVTGSSSPSTGGGSSGGGGGAPSLWFLSVLSLLAAMRRRTAA
ncbi:MAG TPA: immunoglobulin domain-containing protein, partial [Lacunisphaera sp.]